MKINSKNFLSIIVTILCLQSFNSVHAMNSALAKLAVGAAAIATAYTGIWEYVPLQLAIWRLKVSKKKSQKITAREYQGWDDQKLVDTYKNNIELYNDFCTEVQQDENTLLSIQQATNCDIEFWWERKKATKFFEEVNLFSDSNDKRLKIVTGRLQFFKERKEFVELAMLVNTEAVVLREYVEKRTSKFYSDAELFYDLDERIKKYADKITKVEAFEKKSECLEKYLAEAKEKKESLQETQKLIDGVFSPLLKKK